MALVLMIVFGLLTLGVAASLPKIIKDAASGHIGAAGEVAIGYIALRGLIWSIRRWRRLARPRV